MRIGWRRRDANTIEAQLIRESEGAFDIITLPRHPFQIYILLLATCSGLPLLFGYVPSGSIEETLHPIFVKIWGAMLVAGSTLSLIGLYWPWRKDTALIQERTGLVGLGLASVIYSSVTIWSTWPSFGGWFAGCITLGFAVACYFQIRRINPIIDKFIQAAERGRKL